MTEIHYRQHPHFASPAYEAYQDEEEVPFALTWQRDGIWTAIDAQTEEGYSTTATTRVAAIASLREMLGLPE